MTNSRRIIGQATLDFEADERADILARGPVPGVVGRMAWAQAARREHGPCLLFDHVRQALGHDVWEVAVTAPGGFGAGEPERTDQCLGTILKCDTRPWDRRSTEGALLYRGACLGCDWEGPVQETETDAVEDTCDHAWPGWRDLPVVASPTTPKATSQVTERYEAHRPGWTAEHAPLRTSRKPGQTRSYWSIELNRWNVASTPITSPTRA